MVIRYNRDDANFILECLKDYKRLIKKYYSQNSVIVDRVDIVIELNAASNVLKPICFKTALYKPNLINKGTVIIGNK